MDGRKESRKEGFAYVRGFEAHQGDSSLSVNNESFIIKVLSFFIIALNLKTSHSVPLLLFLFTCFVGSLLTLFLLSVHKPTGRERT